MSQQRDYTLLFYVLYIPANLVVRVYIRGEGVKSKEIRKKRDS